MGRVVLIAVAVALGGTIVLPWPPAQAQSAAPAGDAAAEQRLISDGLKLRKEGRDEEALDAFRRAHEISQGARALAQVALAEQALGRWVDAEAHLGQALARRDDPWITRNGVLLGEALDDIAGHLGSVELGGGIVGAEVMVNGVLAGALPLRTPIRLAAGSVVVEVRAPGYLPFIRTVMVPPRGLAREMVVLVAMKPGPSPGAARPRPASPDRAPPAPAPAAVATGGTVETTAPGGWSGRKTLAVVTGVAGLAGLGVGTASLFVRDSRAAEYNRAGCFTGDPQPSLDCTSLADKESAALTVGIVGLAGGGLLLGAAAYLFFADAGPSSDGTKVSIGRRSFAFRCLPAPAPGAGVACAGHF